MRSVGTERGTTMERTEKAELLEVMLDETLSEFQYVAETDGWKVVQK